MHEEGISPGAGPLSDGLAWTKAAGSQHSTGVTRWTAAALLEHVKCYRLVETEDSRES